MSTHNRTCNVCHSPKPLEEFVLHRRSATRKNYCKDCLPKVEHRRSLQRPTRQRFEQKCRERRIAAIEQRGNRCADCGQSFPPCCYDFHHMDPTQKDIAISRLWKSGNIERLEAELAKCVMLCACCHRIRHMNQAL